MIDIYHYNIIYITIIPLYNNKKKNILSGDDLSLSIFYDISIKMIYFTISPMTIFDLIFTENIAFIKLL